MAEVHAEVRGVLGRQEFVEGVPVSDAEVRGAGNDEQEQGAGPEPGHRDFFPVEKYVQIFGKKPEASMMTTVESMDDSEAEDEGVMVEDWQGEPPPGCRRIWRQKSVSVKITKKLGSSATMDKAHLKETVKRHAAALTSAAKRLKATASVDNDNQAVPLISEADFEQQQEQEKEAAEKAKNIRKLTKSDSTASAGSGSSFDFLRRGNSPPRKKKKQVTPKKEKDGEPKAAKPQNTKTSSLVGWRNRAKCARFADRVEKQLLEAGQRVTAFGGEGWSETKTAVTQKTKEKVDAIMNEDESWMLFGSGSGCVLNEQALEYRSKLQCLSEKLWMISDVLTVEEKKSSKDAKLVVSATALRDAVARIDVWNSLHVDEAQPIHSSLRETVMKEIVDEVCDSQNIKELVLMTAPTVKDLQEVGGQASQVDTSSSIRWVKNEEEKFRFQSELWMSALTISFRSKTPDLALKCCDAVGRLPTTFFRIENFHTEMKAVGQMLKWHASEVSEVSAEILAVRDVCKSSSKLMRQFCNLPLGVAALQALADVEALQRKVSFYGGKMESLLSSARPPASAPCLSLEVMDFFANRVQHACRCKQELASLLAGCGDAFAKIKEKELEQVVAFLETEVGELIKLRLGIVDEVLKSVLEKIVAGETDQFVKDAISTLQEKLATMDFLKTVKKIVASENVHQAVVGHIKATDNFIAKWLTICVLHRHSEVECETESTSQEADKAMLEFTFLASSGPKTHLAMKLPAVAGEFECCIEFSSAEIWVNVLNTIGQARQLYLKAALISLFLY